MKLTLPLSLYERLRREGYFLKKYLQLVSQDPRVSNSVTFNGFLLASQQESRDEKVEEVSLDVYLMNDQRVTLRGNSILQTEEVLEVRH